MNKASILLLGLFVLGIGAYILYQSTHDPNVWFSSVKQPTSWTLSSGQLGLIKSGANQSGANQSGVTQLGLTQTGMAQTGAPKTHSGQSLLSDPISGWVGRVTKKPFGLKVSPNDSPITPERFSGYHTGIDFETESNEQSVDIPIFAACAWPLVLKKQATGYGGVAVQSCVLEKRPVTVVYGHLKLSSITAKVGKKLSAGEQVGILGKGYSDETDGERKHLHFGIHKGTNINIMGYVANSGQLTNWLDPQKIFWKK